MYHTVPRAEIQALEYAIRAILSSNVTHVTYTCRSDSTVVVRGWLRGEKFCRKTAQASAWARVWGLTPQLNDRYIHIRVTKVKGHITDDMIISGEWTSTEREGNDEADRLAGIGAAFSLATSGTPIMTALTPAHTLPS